jgi:hypothetical protein
MTRFIPNLAFFGYYRFTVVAAATLVGNFVPEMVT